MKDHMLYLIVRVDLRIGGDAGRTNQTPIWIQKGYSRKEILKKLLKHYEIDEGMHTVEFWPVPRLA